MAARGRPTPEAVGARPSPRFVDETTASGLNHTFDGDPTCVDRGRVAVLDCDEDGRAGPLRRRRRRAGGPVPERRRRLAERCASQRVPTRRRPDLTRASRALTRSTSTATVTPTSRSCATARPSSLRGHRRLPVRTGATRPGRIRCRRTAWATAFSATWEGATSCRPLRSAATSRSGTDGEAAPTYDCAPNALFARSAGCRPVRAPLTLEPGYCALSMLFSDWDGSGRRDLRVSNDRHYYIDGKEQLWRIAPGEPPRLYTAADGWRRVKILGMGIASQDLTGDGLPEVYLTSQGDNKLQTLDDGRPARPTYRDMALGGRRRATRPYVGGEDLPVDRLASPVRRRQRRRRRRPVRVQGEREAQPDYASKDPSNLLLGPGRRDVRREAAEAAGIVDVRPRARRRARRPRPRRPGSTSSR